MFFFKAVDAWTIKVLMSIQSLCREFRSPCSDLIQYVSGPEEEKKKNAESAVRLTLERSLKFPGRVRSSSSES